MGEKIASPQNADTGFVVENGHKRFVGLMESCSKTPPDSGKIAVFAKKQAFLDFGFLRAGSVLFLWRKSNLKPVVASAENFLKKVPFTSVKSIIAAVGECSVFFFTKQHNYLSDENHDFYNGCWIHSCCSNQCRISESPTTAASGA